MEYCHVYTKGLKRNLLFSCDADFIYGMNLIPKSLAGTGVELLAFCLMDNHLHFILRAPRDRSASFIVNYKKSLSAYIALTGRRVGEKIEAGISRIDTAAYLMTSIAYVLRNPVVAGLNCIPQDYRWSSAAVYFRRRTQAEMAGSRTIGTMSYKDKRATIKGQHDFPDDWMVDNDGVILPEFYTAVAEVENLFTSVRRYMYYLSASQEAEVNGTVGEKVRLCDSDLRKEAVKVSLDKFGTASANLLDHAQRFVICKILRKKFGASYKQLGRVMHIDYEYLKMMI